MGFVESLTDLGPALAVVFGPLLALVAVMMRNQHVDSTKTRDLINESNRENRELIEKSNQENRELIRENRKLIENNHRETIAGFADVHERLGEVRERLAHIEGYLKRWPTPPDGEAKAA